MELEGAPQEQHTRIEVVYFFLLRREGKTENWNGGCDDALAVLLESGGRNVL